MRLMLMVGVVVSALTIAVAAAGDAFAAATASGQSATGAISITSPCHTVTSRPHYTSIVVIAFENHDYSQILGSGAPPSYFKTLAGSCGTATNFTAAFYPHSLPNYLAVTSGSTDGISGDCQPAPSCDTGAASIFTQVGSKGWGTRAESIPSPCYQLNTGLYVPRHVPAVYYTRIAHSTCVANVIGMPVEPSTIHRSFVWVAPNLNDDMHNGTPAQASSWLQNFMTGSHGLLSSPTYQAGHMAIFIWFDSAGANGSISSPLPLIVVAPSVGHRVVVTHLNDYYLLHGWEGLLGQPCLANACRVSGFDRFFNL